MSNVGISYPNVLDLVTQDDDVVRLVVAEESALSDEDAPALQEKLNNYLGFAIDGPLVRQYPDSQGKQVCIRIDLYARPTPFIIEFVGHYREAVAPFKAQVELFIQGAFNA